MHRIKHPFVLITLQVLLVACLVEIWGTMAGMGTWKMAPLVSVKYDFFWVWVLLVFIGAWRIWENHLNSNFADGMIVLLLAPGMLGWAFNIIQGLVFIPQIITPGYVGVSSGSFHFGSVHKYYEWDEVMNEKADMMSNIRFIYGLYHDEDAYKKHDDWLKEKGEYKEEERRIVRKTFTATRDRAIYKAIGVDGKVLERGSVFAEGFFFWQAAAADGYGAPRGSYADISSLDSSTEKLRKRIYIFFSFGPLAVLDSIIKGLVQYFPLTWLVVMIMSCRKWKEWWRLRRGGNGKYA